MIKTQNKRVNKKQKLFYRGTVIEFFNSAAYIPEKQKFILAECHKEGYFFQIINITGYDGGRLEGYVKEDKTVKGSIATTKKHLTSEVKRNFGKINMKTFKVIKG
jgi:hypothetical protein